MKLIILLDAYSQSLILAIDTQTQGPVRTSLAPISYATTTVITSTNVEHESNQGHSHQSLQTPIYEQINN